MLFQELILSGIRNFAKLKKIDFSKGFNIIIGDNESGKSTIYDSILSVLFGSAYPNSKNLICEGQQECKAALTFKDKKGDTYRVIRDFSKDKANLFKLDSSNNFIIINKNKDMIDQLMISEIIGLKEDEYAYLFSLKYPIYTSSNGTYESANEETALLDEMPVVEKLEGLEGNVMEEQESESLDRIKNGEELAFKQKRLVTLKEALTKIDQLSKIEYKIDELQDKLSGAKKRLESLSIAEKESAQNINSLESLKTFAELPANINIDELIDTYEKKEIEKAKELDEVREELEHLKERRDLIPNKPVFQNPFLIAGAVLITASLFSVMSFNLTDIFQILFFVGFFGGAGSIAFGIFNDFQNSSKRKELGLKIDNINKQLNDKNTRYGKEDAQFQDILKKTSSSNAQELGLRYKKYQELLQQKEFLEEKKKRLLEGKEREEIEGEFKQLQKEKAELDAKVQGYTGLSTDIYDIEAEIKKIEKEIRAYTGAGNKEKQTAASRKAHNIKADRHSDKTEAISWSILEKILGKDPHDLLPLIENKAKLYLQRLTLGRYSGLNINGGIYLTAKEKDKKAELDKLSKGMIDQVYLALHFALTSILSAKHPFPFLIDDPFLAFDPQREAIAVDILREMAKDNQVIFLSSHKSQKTGDNVIQL
jgi:DNA repair exonuclease SbcCD ATPase subunit